MINKIRGTRDILNYNEYLYIENIIREVLYLFSFNEIKTSTIENTNLFSHSLGGLTDIISKEIYLVNTIHNDENKDKMCLRPEITASIMRSYIEEGIIDVWKVFNIGSVFRHERPQKGRYREFFQASIEIIKEENEFYDVLLIYILNKIFKKLGLSDFKLKINFIGNKNERLIYKNELVIYLNSIKNKIPEHLHSKINIDNVFSILDKNSNELKDALADIPEIVHYVSVESLNKWNNIKNLLNLYEIDYEYSPKLVRGLDYYNGLVYEFESGLLGAQNVFAGGGRYNELGSMIGSKKNLPSTGAGIGIDRLLLILKENNNNNNNNNFIKKNILYSIILSSSEYIKYGIEIQKSLIENNISCEFYGDIYSIKEGLRKSNKNNTDYCLIIGEEEFKNNKFIIKSMNDGNQELIDKDYLIKNIKNNL